MLCFPFAISLSYSKGGRSLAHFLPCPFLTIERDIGAPLWSDLTGASCARSFSSRFPSSCLALGLLGFVGRFTLRQGGCGNAMVAVVVSWGRISSADLLAFAMRAGGLPRFR